MKDQDFESDDMRLDQVTVANHVGAHFGTIQLNRRGQVDQTWQSWAKLVKQAQQSQTERA